MKLILEDAGYHLNRLVRSATEVKILIAFLTKEGISWLPEHCAAIVDLISGIANGITSLECLKNLQHMGANVSIYHKRGAIFHPKAFYFKSAESEALLIGSHNLTGAAMKANYEMSVLVERNSATDELFQDFLAQFHDLKLQKFAFTPTPEFYEKYSKMERTPIIRPALFEGIEQFMTRDPAGGIPIPGNVSTLREYLVVLSAQFPLLDRRQGVQIKNHPLKKLNDQTFRPFFEQIVTEISGNRFKGISVLNVGGNWYTLPNIFIEHSEREPWAKTNERGRLVIQIHYSDDYQTVHFSLLLHYQATTITMEGLHERYDLITKHLEIDNSSETVGEFRHWKYKDQPLFAKPIKTYSFSINALPSDATLYRKLAQLITAYSACVSIE